MQLMAHLVQCGFDEPSWTWTEIWVQTRMPDYCLNWIARSSAIQGWKRCQWCCSPTRKCSTQNWRPFGLKFVMEHWPSGMDARQSAEKPLHETAAVHFRKTSLIHTTLSNLIHTVLSNSYLLSELDNLLVYLFIILNLFCHFLTVITLVGGWWG